MGAIEKVRRIDAMMDHQTLQRGAVIAVILLLQNARLLALHVEQFAT